MYSCSRDTSSLLLREQSWPLNVKNDSQTADNFSWPMLNSLSPATYMAHADYEVKFSFIKSVLLHVERVQLIVPLSVFAVWTTKLQLHSASHTHICNMLLSVHHNSTIQFHLFSSPKLMEYPDPAHKLSANLYAIHHCYVYSEKLLMTDRGTVRNMYSFIPKINLRN